MATPCTCNVAWPSPSGHSPSCPRGAEVKASVARLEKIVATPPILPLSGVVMSINDGFGPGPADTIQKGPATPDPINPQYYKTASGLQAIDVIEAFELDFCLGTAVKYLLRAGKKDPLRTVEDLKKAKWYINRSIEQRGTPEE